MAPIYRKRKYWRYHGDYCGPGWSDGKWQDSVCGYATAHDHFDQTCKDHDCKYSKKRKLKEADSEFYKQNFGKGFKRTAAAVVVGTQGAFRKSSLPEKDSLSMAPSRSRSRSRGRAVSRAPPTPAKRARGASAPKEKSTQTQKMDKTGRKNRRVVSAGPSLSHRGTMGSRNSRVKSLPQILKQGVQVCVEQGHVVTTTTCQYLGHASCPTELCKKAVWRALLKNLLIRMNKLNPQWDAAPMNVAPEDTFVIYYRISSDPNTVLTFEVFNYVALETQESLANRMYFFFMTAKNQLSLDRIQYRPNAGHVGLININLNNARIAIHVVSQLKMQNQTVTVASANEADNVNNVPLIGRCYEGKGTGTKFQVDHEARVPFLCDNKYGTIQVPGLTNPLAEPPQAKLFEGVTKTAKASLAPGEIKTSTIVFKKEMPLAEYFALIFDNIDDRPAPAGYKYKMKKFGIFKFYGLEKQIDSLVGTVENSIKIAYEHDIKFACMVSPKRTQLTTTLYEGYVGTP